MFDNLKPGDIIEKQEFDLETPEGKTYRYTFTLSKSGAFAYGNGTCVGVEINGRIDCGIDTRYDNGVIENFRGWAQEWLYNLTREGCLIYPIDPATGEREEPEQ